MKFIEDAQFPVLGAPNPMPEHSLSVLHKMIRYYVHEISNLPPAIGLLERDVLNALWRDIGTLMSEVERDLQER